MEKDSRPTRRSFLGTMALATVAPQYSRPHFGYLAPAANAPTVQRFYDAAPQLTNFGKRKQAFLSQAYKKVTGYQFQPLTQFMGDCVGCGITTATDYLTVTQTLQRRSSWQGKHSIVGHYVGGKELANQNPVSGGARLVWLIDFLAQYGKLLAKKYGPDDLTSWDKATYHNYRSGLTNNLKAHAKLFPLIHYNKIRSYEEARDAIASGHPVIIGSTMGVSYARRDKSGFFYPKGYTPHCMCCIGTEDQNRPSILIQNSHGSNWARGPKRYGFEPNGSAWLDADTFTHYVSEFDDSWTISMSKGYTTKRKYVLW